jgi:cytochrome c556
MQQAARHFTVVAQETAVTRDLPRAQATLSEITTNCVACHAAYRLK